MGNGSIRPEQTNEFGAVKETASYQQSIIVPFSWEIYNQEPLLTLWWLTMMVFNKGMINGAIGGQSMIHSTPI